MATQITSPANPRVKQLVRLRQRRERDAVGVGLVEGAREVTRAIEAGWRVRLAATCTALAAPGSLGVVAAIDALGVERLELAPAVFEKVSLRQHPDGILALVEPPDVGLEDLAWPSDGLYLVADGLEKPGNLGALIRSADASGVDAVFVTGAGTDLLNPQVIRASMGSVFSRVVLTAATEALLPALRRRAVRLVATTPHAALELWDVDLAGAVAVVLGTEHEGLSAPWLEAADVCVRVPMAGMADSLNVATTGALMLFEARRQRRAPRP